MLPALPIIFEHRPTVVSGASGEQYWNQRPVLCTKHERYRQAKLAELFRKFYVNDVKCLQVCDASELRQGRLVWRGKGNECLGSGWL